MSRNVEQGWQGSWEEGVEQGTLQDFSDAGLALGWSWPVAITDDLETRLIEEIPTITAETLNILAIEKAIVGMVEHLLTVGHRAIMGMAERPEAHQVMGLVFETDTPWKAGGRLSAALMIAKRGDGTPAWVMSLPDEA
jgi:hypothetical protein